MRNDELWQRYKSSGNDHKKTIIVKYNEQIVNSWVYIYDAVSDASYS